MKIFLFLGSRRGYAVLLKLIEIKAKIAGILCIVEDPHEEPYYKKMGVVAEENHIPVFYSNEVKPSEYAAILKKIAPDIAFAMGWRYLITKEAYSIPSKGTFIIHDSLLPKYRGFAPMNWAIINGEKETGVTLFQIAEGVDSGPIVDQEAVLMGPNDTAKMVDEKIIPLYEKIVVRNLPGFESGNIKLIPQDESQATYSCKRTPEDGFIDWKRPAREIYNLIRGLSHPFPGAFTTLQGKKIWIWEAQLPERKEHYVGVVPGRAIGKKNGMIEVLTGDGVLCLRKLQYEGNEEKEAKDISISVKDTFGR